MEEVAAMVKEINPSFSFPHALMSTVLEASHQQIFFAYHLPSLTEVDKKNAFEKNFVFVKQLVFNTIQALWTVDNWLTFYTNVLKSSI